MMTISLRDWKRLNMDTDGPEQDYLIYDLIELVVKHKESLTYKRILTKLRKEKLEEDF